MITLATAQQLADAASVDVRTIWKAFAFGIESLRPLPRKRVVAAALQLGVPLPSSAPAVSR